jgi:uncharacterized protein (TIGR02118 family)
VTKSRPAYIRRSSESAEEATMGSVKMIVMYPPPTNAEEFERRYKAEHVPMAVAKLAGKTKLVATRVVASPQGKPAFHRIAEVHFPSLEALQACAASAGGKETLAHATAISTGGPPVVLVAEEETFTF